MGRAYDGAMMTGSRDGVKVGIAPGLGATGITGHERVWSCVASALDDIGALTTSGTPDVWFYSAHSPKPNLQGPSIAIAYEAGWVVPGAYEGYPQRFVEEIDQGTRAGVTAADVIITGSRSARAEVLEAYSIAPDLVEFVPFGVDLRRFTPRKR